MRPFVSFDDVVAFIQVAKYQSFLLAAENLLITQSALSRRIKKLEERLGVVLLDRTTRSVNLSTMGREFLPEAQRVVEEFNRSVSDFSELIQIKRGFVSFSCNNTISDTLLPLMIKEFRDEHPDIRIRIKEDSSPDILQRVLAGDSEFALAQFGDGHPDLNFEALVDDFFTAVCHKDHPLAKSKSTTWEALKDEQFIFLRPGSGSTKLLKSALGSSYEALSKAVEVGHFHAQLELINQGIGISVIPKLATVKRTDLELVTIPISEPEIKRQLGLVTRRDRSLSPAAEKMTNIARVAMQRWNQKSWNTSNYQK